MQEPRIHLPFKVPVWVPEVLLNTALLLQQNTAGYDGARPVNGSIQGLRTIHTQRFKVRGLYIHKQNQTGSSKHEVIGTKNGLWEHTGRHLLPHGKGVIRTIEAGLCKLQQCCQ